MNPDTPMPRPRLVMPLVLRPDISPALAAVACAHGALAAYLRWREEPDVVTWVTGVFRKRIYQARDRNQWLHIQSQTDALVLTESALDNLTVVAVFRPVVLTDGNRFDDLKLYGAP